MPLHSSLGNRETVSKKEKKIQKQFNDEKQEQVTRDWGNGGVIVDWGESIGWRRRKRSGDEWW